MSSSYSTVFGYHCRNPQVTFVEKSQLKIKSFQNFKHWYLIKGTVVNLSDEGSLEHTLTSPLTKDFSIYLSMTGCKWGKRGKNIWYK